MERHVSEFDLIAQLTKTWVYCDKSVVTGIGDDAAVMVPNQKKLTLLTTDSLVEGVHFTFKTSSPEDIGFKAMAVNLSDIAAMGGTPRYALVSLGIPSYIKAPVIKKIYEGMSALAVPYRVALVGGNISRDPHHFWMAITLMGEVLPRHLKKREGAKIGDLLYVTGSLGEAALGLRTKNFSVRQRRPIPRVLEGQFLGSQKAVTSLIDISDGFLSDLNHVLKASRVGAEIDLKKLPRHKSFENACRKLKLDPLQLLLNGGEDYELLMSVNPKQASAFENQARRKKMKLTCIGRITRGQGIWGLCENSTKLVRLFPTGFDHLERCSLNSPLIS